MPQSANTQHLVLRHLHTHHLSSSSCLVVVGNSQAEHLLQGLLPFHLYTLLPTLDLLTRCCNITYAVWRIPSAYFSSDNKRDAVKKHERLAPLRALAFSFLAWHSASHGAAAPNLHAGALRRH